MSLASSSSSPDLSTLQAWLTQVLGEVPPDWEVTPCTTGLLRELYSTHLRQELSAQQEVEELQQAREEYMAEVDRLGKILSLLGSIEEQMSKGLAGGYLDSLMDLCVSLGLDTATGARLEGRVARLLVKQAELGPRVSAARAELEREERQTVELYTRLGRLGEVCGSADADARVGQHTVDSQAKKTGFIMAKVEQYRKDGERAEAVLARHGGREEGVSHSAVSSLASLLESSRQAAEPLNRELGGFLSLPPSLELARVEVARCRKELEELELEVQRKISSLHI